jgi:hypothetical protein
MLLLVYNYVIIRDGDFGVKGCNHDFIDFVYDLLHYRECDTCGIVERIEISDGMIVASFRVDDPRGDDQF